MQYCDAACASCFRYIVGHLPFQKNLTYMPALLVTYVPSSNVGLVSGALIMVVFGLIIKKTKAKPRLLKIPTNAIMIRYFILSPLLFFIFLFKSNHLKRYFA